jgi:hypothetical protein
MTSLAVNWKREKLESLAKPLGIIVHIATNLFFGSHTVPKRFDPFTAQYPKNHHERMKKIVKIPSGIEKSQFRT